VGRDRGVGVAHRHCGEAVARERAHPLAEAADVVGPADRDRPGAVLAGEAPGDLGGQARGRLAEAAAAVDDGGGAILTGHHGRRRGVHLPGPHEADVGDQPLDPVRVVAEQVGGDERAGDRPGGGSGGARALEDRGREGGERGRRHDDRRSRRRPAGDRGPVGRGGPRGLRHLATPAVRSVP
jgi:hypothetical protein